MAASFYRPFTKFDVEVCLIDREWLLYHTGTGQTHRLNGVVADVFNQVRIAASPVDVESLKLAMSGLIETDEIMRILESLLALYLIESVV